MNPVHPLHPGPDPRSRLLWVTLALCLACSPAGASGSPSEKAAFPDPRGYVSDYAGVVGEDWSARIRSVCKDLERKTGVELVVVTTRSIRPYTRVQEYAGALYKRWGIGTAQREHGVMVLAHTEEVQASVTLGRNMILVIPPTVLERVTVKYMETNFRLGQYGEGLYRTVVALASASQEVRVGAKARPHSRAVPFWLTFFIITTAVGLFWWICRPDKRHPFRRLQRDEFWGSGHGGFGGNFGGFGGGTSGEGYS